MKLQLALLSLPLMLNTSGNAYIIDYTNDTITTNNYTLIYDRTYQNENSQYNNVKRYDNTSNTPYGNITTTIIQQHIYIGVSPQGYTNEKTTIDIFYQIDSFESTKLYNFTNTISFTNEQTYIGFTLSITNYQIQLEDNWRNSIDLNIQPSNLDFYDFSLFPLYERQINTTTTDSDEEPTYTNKIENINIQSTMSAQFRTTYYIESNPINITNPLILTFEVAPNTNMEVIDVGGLLFEILSMPFTFMSGFFNITLFPGTPYQFNISNIILGLLATLALIAIIKIGISIAGKIG